METKFWVLIGIVIGCYLAAEYTFEMYVEQFNKQYPDPDEYERRKAIFEENYRQIQENNHNCNDTCHFEVNNFTDWTQQEIDCKNGVLFRV